MIVSTLENISLLTLFKPVPLIIFGNIETKHPNHAYFSEYFTKGPLATMKINV